MKTANSQKIKALGLSALMKEARRHETADDFVNEIWERLNISKKPLPANLSLRDYEKRIIEFTRKKDKNGFSTQGWFGDFADFYTLIKENDFKGVKGGLGK